MTLRRAGWLLAAINLLSFGPFLFGKGFYMDDWHFFELYELAKDSSLGALISAFNSGDILYLRPGDILYFPLLFWWAGFTAWKYQAAILLFEVAGGVLFYRAFLKATGDGALAFATAAVFVVFPNHGATHHWMSAPNAFVLAMTAGAVLLHLDWVERRSPLSLLLSMLVFAAGTLTYESILPLCLLMPMAGYALRLGRGEARAAAFRAAALESAPFLASVAAAVAWQQVIVPRLFPQGQTRNLQLFELSFLLKVLGRSVECGSTAILALGMRAAQSVIARGAWLWLAAVAAAGWGSWSLWRRLPERLGGRPGVRPWEWTLGSAVVFLGCYAPYGITSQRYVPHVFDEQNRLNASGALPAAMLWAAGILALPRRFQAGAFAAFMAVSALVNWNVGWEWKESWRIQKSTLDRVAASSKELPQNAVLLFPELQTKVGGVTVFNASWSLTAAVRITTGRKDLEARLPGDMEGLHPAAPVFVFKDGLLRPRLLSP